MPERGPKPPGVGHPEGKARVEVAELEKSSKSAELTPDPREVKRVIEMINTKLDLEPVDEAIAMLPEVQKAAKEKVVRLARLGQVKEAFNVINKLKLSETVLDSSEVQEAAKQRLAERVASIEKYDTLGPARAFRLSEATIYGIIKEGMLRLLMSNETNGLALQSFIESLKEYKHDIQSSPDLKEAAKKGVKNGFVVGTLYMDNIDVAYRFGVSKDEIREMAQEATMKYHTIGDINHAFNLAKRFNLPDLPLFEAEYEVKEKLIKKLEHADRTTQKEFEDLISKFKFPESMLQNSWVQGAAEVGVKEILDRSSSYISASYIVDRFKLPKVEVQRIARNAIIPHLRSDNIKRAFQIIETFQIQEALRTPEIRSAVTDAMTRALKGSREKSHIFEIASRLPEEILRSPEIQNAAENLMTSQYNATESFEIAEAFHIPEEMRQRAAKSIISHILLREDSRYFGHAIKTAEMFHVPEETCQAIAKEAVVKKLREDFIEVAIKIAGTFPGILQSPEIQSAAKEQMIAIIGEENPSIHALSFAETFQIPEETRQTVIKDELLTLLQIGSLEHALIFVTEFSIPEAVRHSPDVQEALLGSLIYYYAEQAETAGLEKYVGFGLTPEQVTSDDRMVFLKDERIPLVFRKERFVYYEVTPSARRARMTHAIAPEVYDDLEKTNPAVLAPNEKGKISWERLGDALLEWEVVSGANSMVTDGMKMAMSMFGHETALKYANRPELSSHDAYYFLPSSIQTLQTNGVAPDSVKGLLLEIVKDGSSYEEGTAHHRFAAIVQRLGSVSVADVLAHARRYSQVESLAKLITDFGADPSSVFSSWKRLKKFDEIQTLLSRSEVLDRLGQEQDPAMRKYVEKLAFHPNIDGARVIEFWENPGPFLEVDDVHTPDAINLSKKPSNYLSLPFLGLTGEDLRDALVRGELDDLQLLPPMEREYKLFKKSNDDYSRPDVLSRMLREALGRRKENIAGKAKSVTKLFDAVKKIAAAHQTKLETWVDPGAGASAIEALPPEARQAIESALFHPVFGMTQPVGETYRVVVGKKSDPDMVVAGNDTASCMPFGSGKNNVYMFNPNCVQLVVQRKAATGEWRTAAQSVVTLDLETGKPTPELVERYQETNTRLHDLVDEAAFTSQPVVTCDNIEVAKNEEGDAAALIREAYVRFFKEYLKEHAERLGADSTRVPVGMGYTPAELSLRQIDNTFIPLAPMGYSDNVHEKSFLIETGLPKKETWPKTGTTSMGARDTLAVAALEGKAYHDNLSVLENLHGMQNNIIGKDIANRHFGRPNLSFVHRNEKGIPQGYILAYEGVNHGRPEIYVSDLAADPASKLAGGRLIQTFFDAVLKNYGTESRPLIPIFANARDQTSFRILEKQVDRLAQKAGLVAEMVEIGTHERGGDTFHDVRIYLAKTKEELERQKEEYGTKGYTENSEGNERNDDE